MSAVNHMSVPYTLNRRQWLLMFALVLAVIGLIIVASASMDMAAIDYKSAGFFVQRHGIFLAAGIVCGLLAYQIPLSVWQRSGGVLLIVAFALLAIVLLPGVGKTVNGSTRWINLGPINIQVSEIVKVCALIYVSGYLVRRIEEVRTHFWGFMKPVAVLMVMSLLLLKQPDFGAIVVIMASVFIMLFLAGVKLHQFLLVVLGGVAAASLLVFSSEYRMKRIMAYIDPWAEQYASGYQLVQSLIAFGRGEWFGVGLGNSIQKLFYLPEAHTDFVFAVLAEEFGFAGNLFVIGLFAALVITAMSIGREAERQGKLFNAYLVYGFSIMIGLQALTNIGVASGLLPTKGLTLPLMSYGGSSLMVMCVLLAMIMRADYENQTQSAEQAPAKSTKKKVATKKPQRTRKEPAL